MESNGDVINGEVRLGPTNAFEGLRISSSEFLNKVDERMICSRCFRSRKYFCYTCYMPMDTIKDKLPRVNLPVQIDIIKYPKEVDGKSTATHATILAPDKTTIYTYPNFPDFKDKSKVLILFPGKNSITLEELAEKVRSQQDYKCHKPCSASVDKVSDKSCSHSCGTEMAKSSMDVSNDTFQCECRGCENSSQCSCSVGDCKCNKPLKVCMVGTTNYIATEPLLNLPENGCCYRSLVSCTTAETEPKQKTCLDSERCDCENKYSADVRESHSVVENNCSEFIRLHTRDEPCISKSFSELFPYERIIFIDSTWNQVHKINNDERLDGIQRVEIKSRDSLFWRFQRGKPRTYLATIEAIYYFLVDMHVTFLNSHYDGEYDNLLFFFRFMYEKIHTLYDDRPLRAYSKNATKNPPHKIARLFQIKSQ